MAPVRASTFGRGHHAQTLNMTRGAGEMTVFISIAPLGTTNVVAVLPEGFPRTSKTSQGGDFSSRGTKLTRGKNTTLTGLLGWETSQGVARNGPPLS